MSSRKSLLAATLALGVVSGALAKGNFQAEGFVSDVQVQGTVLTFRYVGSLKLAYATAPAGNPRQQWKTVEFEAVDVTVRIEHWTEGHNPSKQTATPDIAQVAKMLSDLAATKRKALIAIDNAALAFSNIGQLTQVSGSYVYARESPY